MKIQTKVTIRKGQVKFLVIHHWTFFLFLERNQIATSSSCCVRREFPTLGIAALVSHCKWCFVQNTCISIKVWLSSFISCQSFQEPVPWGHSFDELYLLFMGAELWLICCFDNDIPHIPDILLGGICDWSYSWLKIYLMGIAVRLNEWKIRNHRKDLRDNVRHTYYITRKYAFLRPVKQTVGVWHVTH